MKRESPGASRQRGSVSGLSEEPARNAEMRLVTVTGTVTLAIEDVGIVDGHGHLWIAPPEGVEQSRRIELADEPAIRAELAEFARAGGTMVVDCQPGGCGRDHSVLARLSKAAGVLVTSATGFHLAHYYEPGFWLWSATAESAFAHFVEELTEGMRDEPASKDRASGAGTCAAYAKIAFDGNLTGQARVLTEAALHAAATTNAVVLVHTEKGQAVESLMSFCERQGFPFTQLYLCHMDKRPDLALHRELAQSGILLGYDTFARSKYRPEANAWRLIEALAAEGLHYRVAIGLDLAQPELWRFGGGANGLRVLTKKIVPRLRSMELGEDAVLGMAGRNIARRLARGG